MQPGVNRDLSIQLYEKRLPIMVDSNGGLSFPSTDLTGILTCWLVATIGLQIGLSPGSLLYENLDENLPPASTDFGLLFPPILADTDHLPGPTLILDSDKQALQRLVSGTVPHNELPTLIGSIVIGAKAASIVGSLQGSEAQMFIDVIARVCMAFFHLCAVASSLMLLWSGTRYPRS